MYRNAVLNRCFLRRTCPLFWSGTFAGGTGFRFVRYFERSVPHLFTDGTGTQTLSANTDSFGRSVSGGCPHVLQIRQKRPPGDAGNFCSDPAEIFCLTSCFNAIAETASFAADFTDTCHYDTPTITFVPDSNKKFRFSKGSIIGGLRSVPRPCAVYFVGN